jgi:hypothetical protein
MIYRLDQRKKRPYSAQLYISVLGVIRSAGKFADYRDGHVKPRVLLDLATHSRIATQMRANNIGIQGKSDHGSMLSQPASITRSNASASSFVMQPKEASNAT